MSSLSLRANLTLVGAIGRRRSSVEDPHMPLPCTDGGWMPTQVRPSLK